MYIYDSTNPQNNKAKDHLYEQIDEKPNKIQSKYKKAIKIMNADWNAKVGSSNRKINGINTANDNEARILGI